MNEEMLLKEIEMLKNTIKYQDKLIDKLKGGKISLKDRILVFFGVIKK